MCYEMKVLRVKLFSWMVITSLLKPFLSFHPLNDLKSIVFTWHSRTTTGGWMSFNKFSYKCFMTRGENETTEGKKALKEIRARAWHYNVFWGKTRVMMWKFRSKAWKLFLNSNVKVFRWLLTIQKKLWESFHQNNLKLNTNFQGYKFVFSN